MSDTVIGEVGFRFNARFSQLIGRNLISNPIIAVAELVKNSYDADADNINVEFRNLTNGISSLRITDDGEGMSFTDIENKWMMVGTDNKITQPFTPKGRRKLGEKGIGRFSVERLAHKLQIVSTRIGEDFAVSFSIDWDEYEKYDGEFSDIKHRIITLPSEAHQKGTAITLIGLRDPWGMEELLNLQKELELLRPVNINKVSRKKYIFPSSSVKIAFSAPDILKKKLIESNFMSFSQAHLFGEITNDGKAEIQVSINANISASKSDIREKYIYEADDIDISCGPLTFEVFVFLRDKRLYKSLTVANNKMAQYLDTFSGVKIYRDGFRILPFGDTDNDWLELNAKRTSSPEFRLATYNVIGVVYITRDQNPGLQDVLSRENMYETSEYISLKEFVNEAFNKYTALQLGARKKKERKADEEGKLALTSAKKSVSQFTNQVGKLKAAVTETSAAQTDEQKEKQIKEVEAQVSAVASAAETSLEKLKVAYNYYRKQTSFRSREMQIYRNIATLGINAAIFGHEALNQTVESKAILDNVFAEHSALLASVDSLKEQLQKLRKDLILIDEKADFHRNYLRKEKQDRSRYINVLSILRDIVKQHQNAFDAIGVKPNINVHGDESNFIIWGYEGDISTIFTNLVTNAYKALKKSYNNKFLQFILSIKNEKIIVHTMNNGRVIEKDDREKIFEPLFSTYSDGTGLGLTIIQDTLSLYQGAIKLTSDFPNTHFELTIPISYEPEEND